MNLTKDQQQAADWLAEHSGLLIATPGAGKTRTVLAMLEQTRKRALIVAPASVARRTWQDERQRCGSERAVVAWEGLPAQRAQTLRRCEERNPRPHLIMSYELAPKFFTGRDLTHFDVIVFDEVTRLKNPTRTRYRALANKLREHPHKIGLTGTPTSNHYYQLFGQLKITGGMPMLYEDWLACFFDSKRIRIGERAGRPLYATTWHDRKDTLAAITPLLEPRVWRMPASTGHGLREIDHWVDTKCELAPPYASQTAKHQYAQGRAYYDSSETDSFEVHTAKLDRLIELLEDFQGEPVLIFYQFQHDLIAIEKACEKARLTTWRTPRGPSALATCADEWNAEELEALIVHPQSAGHGLNLQYGGHQIIWYGLPWDAELYWQGNGRLADRKGQTKTVMVHRILAEDSVDVQIAAGLVSKQTKAQIFEENYEELPE